MAEFSELSDRKYNIVQAGTAKDSGGVIMPIYMNFRNPLVVNADNKFYFQVYNEYFQEARSKGYDGIIVKNVIDNPRGEQRAIDVFIVFNSNQIKSVYNRGTFDLNNDNIYYQGQISLETVRKAREVKAALERIASGSAEETVKNLRNDLEQYGGTNDVTFVFGDEKKGIRHIAEKHGVKTLLKVFDAVVDGDVSKFVKGKKTVHLSKDGVEAILSLDENGNKKTWLLTGFDTKISPDEEREFRATLNSTQSKPTFSRQELGAELNSYIISNDTGDVNNTLYQGQIAENVVNMPTVEEFKNPVRDYELPRLNKGDLRKLGKEDKPVVLKKNIIEKNKRNHPEVDVSEYDKILIDTLINTSEIIQVQPQQKPNYYTFINEGRNDVSVVELSENKDNYEVVNFFKVNKKRIDEYRKKAVKDGGDIIITEREPQGAARLSALLNSDTNSITQTSENVNNTLYQGREAPKGAYMKNLDYNGIIYLFERADASTFMHETAHFFKEELKRFDTARSREMLKKVDEWENSQFGQRYNIKEENGSYAVTDKLGMVVYDNFDSAERAREYAKSEIFARGFEQYLRDGQAPNNYLKQAFRSFWGWLQYLYKSAKQLNVSLNEDIKAVYADIIGGKDLDFYLSAPVDEVLQQHFEEQKERKDYLDEQIGIAQAQARPVKKSFAANLAQEKTDGAKGRNEWWSKAIIPISTRAKRVNQGLKNRLRAYDFNLANKLNSYYAEIKPFLDKWAKMTETDAVAFDLALKNSYMEKQLEIVKKYDAYDEFVRVKNLLNSLFDQAVDFGIEMGYTADYFPRQIKDVDGFMSYIYGSPMSSQLRRALREADPDNVMKPEERAEFLNKYLRGFNRRDLSKPLPSNDRSIEAYGDVLQKCDAVIFNGEGSLHDGAAINMFEKCRLAKELGKKVFLINSVWQNNTETNRYLNLFDLVTFRESLSYEEALPFCKEKAMVVPDLAFYGDRLLHEDKNTTKLLFTDSVKASNSRKLYSLAKKYSAEFYGMTENACFPQLSEEVIANLDEKAKIVTGRFHTLVFAMKYKIPALVLTSNTHKIEGLLKDSGLEDYLLKIDKNAEQNITRFIASNNDDFVLKASKYTLEAQMKIENVFVKIRSFFKA